MDEYIYHNMSIEEDKLFVKDNKIQLKQACSWNDEINKYEDPFIEKLKIVGSEKHPDTVRLESIKELVETYIDIYEKKTKGMIRNSNSEIELREPNKLYYNIFTDILNITSILYTTYVSCWTRSNEQVGIGNKVSQVKINKKDVKYLKPDKYKLSIFSIKYYSYNEMSFYKRLERVMSEDGITPILLLSELPEDFEEEQEERIILRPYKPDFSKTSSLFKYDTNR